MGGVVSTVKAGLTVELKAASRLLCNQRTITTPECRRLDVVTAVGGTPSITVTEGFARAWEDNELSSIGATNITVKMLNLPKGVNLRWPQR